MCNRLQPGNGRKPKMRKNKLRRNVNWQGGEKQKGVKETGVQGLCLSQDREYTYYITLSRVRIFDLLNARVI